MLYFLQPPWVFSVFWLYWGFQWLNQRSFLIWTYCTWTHGIIFNYRLILSSNSNKRTDSWFQHLQTMKFLHLVLCPWIWSSVSWFIIYGNWNRMCILLLCENYININYVELVHNVFQVYSILPLFCLLILLIFEIETPAKNLNLAT